MPTGLRTNSGAGTVRFGTAGVGANGKCVIQVKTIANAAKFKGRLAGADADIDLQCYDASDPDLAAAATFGAAGIFYVEDHGCIDVAVEFGAGDTVYVQTFGGV
jgi:hypothetical protein